MSDSNIYGSNPTGIADKVAGEGMRQLSDAGSKVDVHGVRDGRVSSGANMGKKGSSGPGKK